LFSPLEIHKAQYTSLVIAEGSQQTELGPVFSPGSILNISPILSVLGDFAMTFQKALSGVRNGLLCWRLSKTDLFKVMMDALHRTADKQ